MHTSKKLAFVGSVAASLALSALAQAAAFTSGNLVVLQVGADDASTALNNTAIQSYLKEFTVAGTTVQSFATDLRNQGTTSSEGFLAYNSGTLSFGGYTAAVGTATPGTSATSGRAVEVYTLAGTGTVTTLNETTNLGNIRSAVSTGVGVYAGTSTGGIRYISTGSTDLSTQVTGAPTNARVVKINNNQLYVSTGAANFLGVSTVGTGTPTNTGNTTTLFAGTATSPFTTHSAYDYYFSSDTTLYIADDGSVANGGGIQRFDLVGGTWTYSYLIATGAVRGLTGVTAAGVTTLFATTGPTSTTAVNSLLSVIDVGAASVPTTLATSPANTVFRGVAFLPANVPVPGIAGDYNGDGYVDAADYTVWADHFGQTGTGIQGDGNNDGVVDAADYTIWADHFGQGVPPVGVSSAVPEPTVLAFAAPAMALLARRRR